MIVTSPTALEQYDRCPLLYHLTRHLKLRSPTNPAALLGRVCHDTLEQLSRAHLAIEGPQYLDAALASALYEEQWKRHGMSGKELFVDGLQMISLTCEKQGVVDPQTLFALEHPFEIIINGEVLLRGRIDRIDRIETMDEETGEVLLVLTVYDYKSTRQFLTKYDVIDSIQVASYAMAVTKLEPSADKVRAGYWMLRSGEPLIISHTAPELDEWREYIIVTAEQMEADTTWRARLNVGCPYCPGQDQCPEYERAVRGERKTIAESMDDLDAVSKEREDIKDILRILEPRKKKLTDTIKSFLAASGEGAEMGETFYRLSRRPSISYPAEQSVNIIAERTGIPESMVIGAVCQITNTRLNALLKEHSKTHGIESVTMLRSELENIADRTATTALYPRKRKGKNTKSS